MAESKPKEAKRPEQERRPEPCEYVPVHDGLGITHWLPPKRCKDCDG